MKKLLTSFDREFKKVLETINKQSILDIVVIEKSLIEREKKTNWPRIQLSGSKKLLAAGIEIWQQQQQQQQS